MTKKEIYLKLLELEEDGKVLIDIGGRGGHYGLELEMAVEAGFVPNQRADLMPSLLGAYCNYLGGGIRGALVQSDYDTWLPKHIAKKIDRLTEMCVKRYKEIEDGTGLNEEEYPDGDTNWNAHATKQSRKAGIVSAY